MDLKLNGCRAVVTGSSAGIGEAVALAWLRAQGGVTPILGARTAQQLAEDLTCIDVDSPPEELARLDRARYVARGFPHDFLAGADYTLGGMSAQLDKPPGRPRYGWPHRLTPLRPRTPDRLQRQEVCLGERKTVLMGQYMLLLVGRGAQPQATDAETQDYNARWMEYFSGLARSGALRAGAPFAATGKIVQGGTVSDAEVREVDIGGFLLIEAESADAAAQIAERAPHIALGGSVIIRPCLEIPPPPGRPQ